MKLGTTDISTIKLGSTGISKAYLGSSEVYSAEEPIDYSEPFYVKDVSGSDNTLNIFKRDGETKAPTLTIYKSLDGKTWESMGSTSTSGITATVPANGKLYLRCSASAWTTKSSYYFYSNGMDCSANYNVGGNIMSLLYGSSFTGNETAYRSSCSFCYLFYFSKNLVSAKKLLLPATNLMTYDYYNMFYHCTSLREAPELPSTGLASYCFKNMFCDCYSLTTAPELPATTLSKYCYNCMFDSCTSLNYIKVHFTSWPSTGSSSSTYLATWDWTHFGENTTGTFICPSTLTQKFNASRNRTTSSTMIENASNAIPYGWTVQTF